jgi:hypothetical protein
MSGKCRLMALLIVGATALIGRSAFTTGHGTRARAVPANGQWTDDPATPGSISAQAAQPAQTEPFSLASSDPGWPRSSRSPSSFLFGDNPYKVAEAVLVGVSAVLDGDLRYLSPIWGDRPAASRRGDAGPERPEAEPNLHIVALC